MARGKKSKKIRGKITSTPDIFIMVKPVKTPFDEENKHWGAEVVDNLCDFLGISNLEEGGFSITTSPNFSNVTEAMPGNLAHI